MSKLRSLFVALLALAFLVPSAWSSGVYTRDMWVSGGYEYKNGEKVVFQRITYEPVYNPQVNLEGTGDLLFFPFFYADSVTKTKIRVINVNPRWGIVAKVILRSSMCSEELRDFMIYLSPNDVWTGEIVFQGDKVVIKSTDDSVIVPTNHKVASESNPFVVHLRKTKNPKDVNNFGYIEVVAVAKVNWGWSDGSKTFRALAKENGFDNLHEFMSFLYNPSVPWSYAPVAYCNGTELGKNRLSGLIAPLAYDVSTVGSEAATYDPNCVPSDNITGTFVEHIDAPLYGTAEVMVPGGYAAYKAVAVRGFVALGATLKAKGCDNPACPCTIRYDLTAENPGACEFSYKVPAAVDTPLNYAGVVDALDVALLKTEMNFPYYDSGDSDAFGSFAILFSPTMQTSYSYNQAINKYTCMPQNNITSTIWSELWPDVLRGTLAQFSLAYASFDNSEHAVSCEFSPCLLKPYELYPIGPVEEVYDPFFYSEGWLRVFATSGWEYDNVSTCCDSQVNIFIAGVPMIPFAGFYNADGVTFIEPSYKSGYECQLDSLGNCME